MSGKGAKCKRGWGRAAVVTLVAASLALPANAGEISDLDRDRAGLLMDHAQELIEAGRYAEAVDAIRQADAIVGVPTTRMALAKALVQVGSLVEAREIALEVARSPAEPGEPPPFARARKEARDLAVELGSRIPRVAIAIDGLPPGVQPDVTMDGRTLSAEDLAAPLAVDPGTHEVRVVAPGYRDEQSTVTAREWEQTRVRILMRSEATGTPGPRPQQVPKSATEPAEASSVPGLAYVGFGVGAVGLTVGTVTGVWALSKSNQLEEDCGGQVCTPAYEDDLDSTRRMSWISNVAFGVGLVGTAVGIGALLADDGSSPADASDRDAQLTPVVGPAHLGVRGTF